MNPSDEINNEMLTAYFDGELSQAEQLQVEQSLFGCPNGRRQLRQWAVLRQELQQWAEASADPSRSAGREEPPRSESRAEASGPTSVVMQRVLAAFRDGSANWSTASNSVNAGSGEPSASVQSGLAGTGLAGTGSDGAGADGAGSDGAAIARGTSANGDWTRAKDGWLSDYRRLTPRQRMQRWNWQLGLAVTAAAALLLTVWLNPWSSTRVDTALGPMAGPPSRMLEETAAEGLAPMAAAADSMRFDSEPMSSADSELGLADGREAGSTVEPPLESYTAFLVYDATDQTASLEALQTVLTQNSLALTEIFHEDGNPAVVLSGDTRQLAEVLEAFQSQGEHQLAFVSKIDNAAALTFGSDLIADGSLEDAPLQANRMGMESRKMAAGTPAPPAADSMIVLGSEAQGSEAQGSEADAGAAAPGLIAGTAAPGVVPSGAAASGAAAPGLIAGAAAPGTVADAAVVEGPLPDGGLAMKAWPQVDPRGVGGEVAADTTAEAEATELPASVLNSQLRQDIIRSQANLLANSIAPPANLTLEEFLRERPNQRQPRIPFDPGLAIDAAGSVEQRAASKLSENLQGLGRRSAAGLGENQAVQPPGAETHVGPRPSAVDADVNNRGVRWQGGRSFREPSVPRADAMQATDSGRAVDPSLAAAAGRAVLPGPDLPVSGGQVPASNSQIVVIIRGKKPVVSAGTESSRPTEPARGPRD